MSYRKPLTAGALPGAAAGALLPTSLGKEEPGWVQSGVFQLGSESESAGRQAAAGRGRAAPPPAAWQRGALEGGLG